MITEACDRWRRLNSVETHVVNHTEENKVESISHTAQG